MLRLARPLSFRSRLTLRWTAAFGLVLALAHTAVYVGYRRFAHEELDAQLTTLAATELASAVDEYRGLHLHDFPEPALHTRPFADKFAQFYDRAGHVLLQSPALEGGGPLIGQAMIARALAGEVPLTDVTVRGRPGRVAVLRTRSGQSDYVLAVGVYMDPIEQTLGRLAGLLVGVWFAGIAATAAIGYLLASRALKPIDHITARARAIARGDIEARLGPPEVDDEVGRMTRLLNEMLERLHGVIDANRRFASDAAHELRSPLTAMAGEVDVALLRERPPEEYREALQRVRERLDHMAHLTEDLMVLVRAQEQQSEVRVTEVRIAALVELAARTHAREAAAAGVSIAFQDMPDLFAYADPRLLARVVDNLVTNAIKYNREGGDVIVSGGFQEARAGAWEAGVVIVRFSDTGPGIPEDKWEQVFERFFRLDRSRSRRTGGTGLGLAICRAVLSVFNGTVRIVDSSGRGSTFEMRLPGHVGSSPIQTRVLTSGRARPDSVGVS